MVYDVTMLKAFYASYKGKMEHVRAVLQRPLTLAEKRFCMLICLMRRE